MTKTTCYPSCRSQFQNNSPPSCQLFQLNVQFFTDHQHVTAINKHLGRIKGKGYLATLISWTASQWPRNKGKNAQTSTDWHLLCQNPISSVPSLRGVPEHSSCQLVGLCGFLLHAWALDSWWFSICWNKCHRNEHLCIFFSYIFFSQLLPCSQHNHLGPSTAGLLNTGAIPAKAGRTCTSHLFVREVKVDNNQPSHPM